MGVAMCLPSLEVVRGNCYTYGVSTKVLWALLHFLVFQPFFIQPNRDSGIEEVKYTMYASHPVVLTR